MFCVFYVFFIPLMTIKFKRPITGNSLGRPRIYLKSGPGVNTTLITGDLCNIITMAECKLNITNKRL